MGLDVEMKAHSIGGQIPPGKMGITFPAPPAPPAPAGPAPAAPAGTAINTFGKSRPIDTLLEELSAELNADIEANHLDKIEVIFDLLGKIAVLNNHRFNQVTRVQKIETEDARVASHKAHLGVLNGRLIKLICGFAAFSGGTYLVGSIFQMNPTGAFGALNSAAVTLGVRNGIVDVTVGAKKLGQLARRIIGFAKSADAFKSIPEAIMNANKTEHESATHNHQSRVQDKEKAVERTNSMLDDLIRRLTQIHQALHDAKSQAAQAV